MSESRTPPEETYAKKLEALGFAWDVESQEWTNECGQSPWEEKIERELAARRRSIIAR